MKYTIYTVTGTTITAQEIEAPEHDGYLLGVDLVEQSRHASQYARSLRGAARGLWAGVFDIDQAFDAFAVAVSSGLTQAWNAGAAECGIMPADMTAEEKSTLAQIIANEQRFIFPLLLDVEAGSKANGGLWRVFKSRLETWGLRYDDVVTRARLTACSNQKLEWVQGPTSDKCPTCTRMNGKVKRSSQWQRNGVHPRAPKNDTIQCQGWRCLCTLEPTDKPLSRGPLPRWP